MLGNNSIDDLVTRARTHACEGLSTTTPTFTRARWHSVVSRAEELTHGFEQHHGLTQWVIDRMIAYKRAQAWDFDALEYQACLDMLRRCGLWPNLND